MKKGLEQYNKQLVRAIKNKDAPRMHNYISKIAKAGYINELFDMPEYNGFTLLMYFVMANDEKTVSLLIEEHKADRLIVQEQGYNALFLFTEISVKIRSVNLRILNLLLAQNPMEQICNIEKKAGYTVIHYCILHNQLYLLNLYLSTSADPLFYRTIKGYYPIHLACTIAITPDQRVALLGGLLKYHPHEQVLLTGRNERLPIHEVYQCYQDERQSLGLLMNYEPLSQLIKRYDDNVNLLIVAASRKDLLMLGYLRKNDAIHQCANTITGDYQLTALHNAIIPNSNTLIRVDENIVILFVTELIKNGANVLAGKHGMLAIECCCEQNYPEVAKILLDQSAVEQLNNCTSEGYTPLASACDYGSVDVVRLLLDIPHCQGSAYLLSKTNSDLSALKLAVSGYVEKTALREKYFEIIKMLLNHYPIPQLIQKNSESTILIEAVKSGCTELVELLLSYCHNQQVLLPDQSGEMPIHAACDRDNTQIVILLLKESAEQQLKSRSQGFTPLHRACFAMQNGIIAEIIKIYPSSVVATYDQGLNILHIASYTNDEELAKMLVLRHPSFILQMDQEGILPISIAVQSQANSVFRLLWSHETCLKQQDILQVNNNLAFLAVEANNFEVLREILSQTEQASNIKQHGANLLHWAAVKGRYTIVEFLLSHTDLKQNINDITSVLGELSSTALHLAIENGFEGVVDLLCQYKADLTIEDSYGRNPLMRACIANETEIARILIECGATPDSIIYDEETGDEFTPLSFAELHENKSLIKIIHAKSLKLREVKYFSQAVDPSSASNSNVEISAEKSVSGRAYLLRNGYSLDDINDLKRKSPIPIQSQLLKLSSRPITWCAELFDNGARSLIQIQISNQTTPHFLYIPDEIKKVSGLGALYWNNFLQKSIRFSNKCVKKLSSDDNTFRENIKFGNMLEGREYQFELKITDVDRILLFSVTSDDGSACLLVGARYLPGGLHSQGQINSLKMKIRAAGGIVIEVPYADKKHENEGAFALKSFVN
jgi:ankyrin repeat protein